MNKKLLGILGGLGPMSSVYFYELLTARTAAARDQDHIDLVISSRAATPDRTAYIINNTSEDPLGIMVRDARALAEFGADIIAMPCNTAHYFYDRLSEAVDVPIIHIIKETVALAERLGVRRLGVMATEGTTRSGAYAHFCGLRGIECIVPGEDGMRKLNEVIYGAIKRGQPPDIPGFLDEAGYLMDAGCERIVLGCTELSLIKRNRGLPDCFIDSLEVLAFRTIIECGKVPIGFPDEFYY